MVADASQEKPNDTNTMLATLFYPIQVNFSTNSSPVVLPVFATVQQLL